MFSKILRCIELLTISDLPADLTPERVKTAAGDLLAFCNADGSAAVALDVLQAALRVPVLAALAALQAAGLLAFGVVPLAGGGSWVVFWFVGFSGDTMTRRGVTGNVSSDGCLFVCSDPELVDIYINKQTNNTRAGAHMHAHTCEGAAAESLPVTGNVSSDKGDFGRIVALLTDNEVTRGLVVNGAAVGALPRDKARDLARELVAAGRSFDFVLGNVCEWRRQVGEGRLFSPVPALVSRLRRGFDGSITASDRAESWFDRHSPVAWRDYFPAGHAEVSALPVLADRAAVTGKVSSEIETDPVALAWRRMVERLASVGAERFAAALEGSSVSEDGQTFIVRLAGRGADWIDWLQDRGGRQVADWFGLELGRTVAVEFARSVGGDD